MIEPDKVTRFTRQARALVNDPALDADALAQLVEIRDAYDAAVAAAARKLNAAGVSWAEIARPLGVTRQAAHKAYSAVTT